MMEDNVAIIIDVEYQELKLFLTKKGYKKLYHKDNVRAKICVH
jgi:hypothetical protein